MKTCISFLLGWFLIFSQNSLSAQDFFFELGLNLSDYHNILNNKTNNGGSATIPGWRIAVTHEATLGTNFGFTSGLSFSGRGFKTDTLRRNVYYLNLPINLKYYFNNQGDKNYLMLGPYAEMALFGNDVTPAVADSPSITEDTRMGAGGVAKFDAGFTFGFGRQWKKIDLSIQYNLGLVDLTGDTSRDNGSFNRTLAFIVCYRLGHGKQ